MLPQFTLLRVHRLMWPDIIQQLHVCNYTLPKHRFLCWSSRRRLGDSVSSPSVARRSFEFRLQARMHTSDAHSGPDIPLLDRLTASRYCDEYVIPCPRCPSRPQVINGRAEKALIPHIRPRPRNYLINLHHAKPPATMNSASSILLTVPDAHAADSLTLVCSMLT